jgi:hypothetical protein
LTRRLRIPTSVTFATCLIVAAGCLSPQIRAANELEGRVVGKASGPARLGKDLLWVGLTDPATGSPLTRDVLHNASQGRRLMLVLSGISAEAPPNSAFDIFLTPSGSGTPSKDDPRYVGSLSFYGEINHGPLKATPSSRSYDVTEVARRLSASNSSSEPIGVAIVPARTPSPDARPTIGSIEIVVP